MIAKTEVVARQPNWLPLPGQMEVSRCLESVPDQHDLFPKGEVVSFYSNQAVGVVRTEHGSEIEFHVSDIDLVGPKNSPSFLATGVKVGFDYSHTSHGLRITRLKIY